MKKKIWLLAAGFVFSGQALTYAQDIKELPPVTITATQKTVPQKVWDNLYGYFSDVKDPKWYSVNKNFLIRFMTDEKTNHVLFTKRGELVYHISYGYEHNLPKDIRDQVKRTYYDYNITRAIKVTEANREIWVVNVEDAKNLILVRLEGGDMEEVQKFKKS